jgi:hypothetical protein
MTSSAVFSRYLAMERVANTVSACSDTTPLGAPVVPDV